MLDDPHSNIDFVPPQSQEIEFTLQNLHDREEEEEEEA
jgi:hypothetical protein